MRGRGDQAGRRTFHRATTSGFCVMEIIGTSDYFSCKHLTAPLFFNPSSQQTSRETVGTSKRVTRTKIHIILQSVYIRKNRHKKRL